MQDRRSHAPATSRAPAPAAVLAAALAFARIAAAAPPAPPLAQSEPRIHPLTSWVGNTWGGWTAPIRMPTGQSWPGLRGCRMQPGIWAIAVASDGTVFVEGRGDGRRYSVLRDGELVENVDDAPYHIWFSGACAVDDRHFYFAQRHPGHGKPGEKTADGGPKFTPAGELWTGIARLDRAGRFAPFDGGFGDYGHVRIVDRTGEHLRGMAADGRGRLYVANASAGQVLAFDGQTMKPVERDGRPIAAPVPNPSRLAIDGQGRVWALTPRELRTRERAVRIRCGGGPAEAGFLRDRWRWKGSVVDLKEPVDLSRVANPAPASLYTSVFVTARSLYKLTGFAPRAPCTVRLHMVEPFAKQAGERTFTVRINHVPVLSNYDLFADTGDRWRATVKEFAATASQEGEVAILLDGGTGGKCAAVCAIEVLGRETERSVEAPAVARAFTRDLEPLPDRVVFAPHRDPVGMAFGPDGRLYVADNGPDLNVRATTSKALPSPGAPSA